MAILKTLDDLADFANYRKMLSDALRSLKDGESVHISKDDFEFEVRGAPWPGRVVLVGPSGDASLSNLKRGGIQFKSGTGRSEGDTVLVTGLGDSFLKLANKTLDKLSVGRSLAADRGEQEADGEAEDANRDEPRAKKLKAKVHGELKELLAANPPNRAALTRLVKTLGEHEKSGAWSEAIDTLEELVQEIAEGRGALTAAAEEAASEVEAEEADAEAEARATAKLAAAAKKRKTAVLAAARKALAENPDLRSQLGVLLKDVERLEKNADYEALMGSFDAVEELVEEAGDEEEPDASVLESATDYGKFLRRRLKAMSREVNEPQIVYVGRTEFAFPSAEDPEVNLLLTGKGAKKLVKVARQAKVKILKGLAYRDGNVVHLLDLPKRFRKLLRESAMAVGVALKFVIDRPDDSEAEFFDDAEGQTGGGGEDYQTRRRRLEPGLRSALAERRGDVNGLRIADEMANDAAEAGDWPRAMQMLDRIETLLGQASGQTAEETVAAGTTAYRQRLVQFAQTKTQVRSQLARVTAAVADLPGEADVAQELASRLEGMFDEIGNVVDAAINASADQREPVTAAVRSQISGAIDELESDELLAHVEANPWKVSIKAPLLTALRGIQAAMPA